MEERVYDIVAAHLKAIWPAETKELFSWKGGPAGVALPHLRVCRVAPTEPTDPWVYLTVGLSEEMANENTAHEFVIISPWESAIHIETLAVLGFYHRTNRLYPGSIVDIGREWIEGSGMDHFLVSIPYPYGPDFEYCWVNDEKKIRFLWLVPIYASEAEYAQQHGVEALEERFDEQQIDVVDASREPVS